METKAGKYIKELWEAHKFFVRESEKFVGKSQDIYWTTKDFDYLCSLREGLICRGSRTTWHYPLGWRNRIYYPIAYIKFMFYSLRDLSVKE